MTRNQIVVDANSGGFSGIVGNIYERGVEEVDIAEYNDWKRKQEEEERKLAEQYGMPYKENDSIK